MYYFIPAERNDTIQNTGRHKYLPINICENEGENCVQISKIDAKPSDRIRREVFSNLRDLPHIAKLEGLDLKDVDSQTDY